MHQYSCPLDLYQLENHFPVISQNCPLWFYFKAKWAKCFKRVTVYSERNQGDLQIAIRSSQDAVAYSCNPQKW